ncbi:Methyltransferase type 11 [Haloterrigena turkmenica DSM 5511]|uniref:Methyltransferase type 11 n=1 Tax=Haloterrigena turkmenica (strain ATCC 51198 / DSM 5511 / JCM 9101 / NCIMB 13204 / VKM B-1734 / 4k) TaxID=543526 RepID=D2RV81_HALTV|nr:class I SAM-dependent methyltransferase [Haloterrigena turkmenica]ADB61282.1 Methyltransferase type 11 [Haloterrigena turkmenica DSM 5511]
MTRSSNGDEDVKDVVREYWNGRADSYDDDGISGVRDDEQREAWLAVLRQWTGDPPRRVLDLGCGTGTISLLLAELGHDVSGIDLTPEMLERARSKAREARLSIGFGLGDAEALPVPDDACDVVTARHLIWTLPNPSRAIREWRRVVRPGGRIILLEGRWDFPEPWDEYREIYDDLPLYRGRPPGELVDFLADHGLERIEREPLMDATLWGEDPEQELYVVGVDVPE